MTAYFVVADVREALAAIPDGSIDLVLTSPPFLALRSYLPADHPDKAKEIGSEPTPADFIDTLLDLTVEWRRVLAPHGSLCVELGDTYSGSGGAGGDYAEDGLRAGQPRFKARNDGGQYGNWPTGGTKYNLDERPVTGGNGWPQAKSLCMIPELYRLSLAYGRNILRPERTIEPWRVRNVVRWCRPNPPVGALGDKFRPATSDMVVACTARDRWFDLDAVRTEHQGEPRSKRSSVNRDAPGYHTSGDDALLKWNPAGAPPLDWWQISTEPYRGSHYATWPTKLLERPIKAMCPPGGWVLDPFAGSGTTLAVATGHGRKALGIDLDARNLDLARERVGMWLSEAKVGDLSSLLAAEDAA